MMVKRLGLCVILIVALSRPAGNTSDALECGFYWDCMISKDFTKRGPAKATGLCIAFKRFRSKAFSSVPAESVMAVFYHLWHRLD